MLPSAVLRSFAVAFVLATVAVAPATAAKRPTIGKYTCQQYSYGLKMYIDNGWLKIAPDQKYRASGGNLGKYRYRAANGVITFVSGAYKKWNWHGFYESKGTDGRDYDTITVRDGNDDSTDLMYCYRYQ